MRKKCPYSELFWSAFSRIRTEYGEILRISPHSVRTQENVVQNNSKDGHFSCSVHYHCLERFFYNMFDMFEAVIDRFPVTVVFLYPLKTSESQWFL